MDTESSLQEETVSFDEAIQLKNSDLQNFFNLFLDCHVASLLAMTILVSTWVMPVRNDDVKTLK